MTRDRTAVIQNERDWHDQEAHRRISLNAVLYAPPAFNDVTQTAFDFLDGQPEERVLDMGSGEGKETLILASRGLCVVSMDLSHKQLCAARERVRAHAPEAQVFFIQANAEESPFAYQSFRIIYGKAVLHHLDLAVSSREVHRLLKPGGRASFAEPFARHPLFRLGRRFTPQLRTEDEHPMLLSELGAYAQGFQTSAIKTFFLFTPLAYVIRLLPGGEKPFQKAYALLARLDAFLFAQLRQLQHWAWYGVLNVQKRVE